MIHRYSVATLAAAGRAGTEPPHIASSRSWKVFAFCLSPAPSAALAAPS